MNSTNNSMNSNSTPSDLDMFDVTLEDLADMPSIQLFPNGAHKCNIGFKVDRKKQSVQVSFTYIEPLELAAPDATPPQPGDKNMVFINLRKKDGTPNEYAQGTLKMILAGVKSLGGNNSGEIMEAAEGAEVAVVTKIRVGKGEYEGRDNLDIVTLELM